MGEVRREETEAAQRPTPIWISRRLQIALVIAGIALLAWAIWVVPAILMILLAAAALALILSFPVRALSRLMPRWLAVLITLLLVLGLLVLAAVILFPLLIDQLTRLIAAWPSIESRLDQMLDEAFRALQHRGLLTADDVGLRDQVRQAASNWGRNLAGNALAALLRVASGAAGFAVQMIAIVIVAIYLLLDVRRLRDAFIELAPTGYEDDVAELWDTFGESMSRYLSGVVVVAVITGTTSGITLWLLGVPYALLLGVWVAFTSFIPVFGTYLGVVPALPLALAQSPTTAILTILTYVIIQNVQDNVLTPRVQGEAARVHPIIILLSVLWTGIAFGLFWSALAVPALVMARVLFDFSASGCGCGPDDGHRRPLHATGDWLSERAPCARRGNR
jgi:predicted PurR-regulated permease PerM